jgi:hypothetical protein
VARSSADKSIPPPLRALGGWADAEWFDRAVLLQDEVVGLTLPKLPGLRKQSFELAERAMGAFRRERAPRAWRRNRLA